MSYIQQNKRISILFCYYYLQVFFSIFFFRNQILKLENQKQKSERNHLILKLEYTGELYIHIFYKNTINLTDNKYNKYEGHDYVSAVS